MSDLTIGGVSCAVCEHQRRAIDKQLKETDPLAQTLVRSWFWFEGTTRCRRCGHKATGELATYTEEQAMTWEQHEFAASAKVTTSTMKERPAELSLWWANGAVGSHKPPTKFETECSVGMASKRALGFIVKDKDGKQQIDFVLNREQVTELFRFLQRRALPALK